MSDSNRKIEIRYKTNKYSILVPDSLPEKYIDDLIQRFFFFFDNYVPYDLDDIEFIWCLVGNIIDKHYYGEDHVIKRGTKQFPPNAKVYCFPAQWGDGYENILVMGKPRKKRSLIRIIMKSKYIKNWRLQKVYDKHVITEMMTNFGWTNKEEE